MGRKMTLITETSSASTPQGPKINQLLDSAGFFLEGLPYQNNPGKWNSFSADTWVALTLLWEVVAKHSVPVQV